MTMVARTSAHAHRMFHSFKQHLPENNPARTLLMVRRNFVSQKMNDYGIHLEGDNQNRYKKHSFCLILFQLDF